MPFENYGQLKTNVRRYMDRNDSATIDMIPDFIYLAEKQIMKTLFGAVPEIPSLENEVEVQVYPNTDFVDMPADMGRIKYIYLPTQKVPLKVTTYPELLEMKYCDSSYPLHYARHIRRIYFRPVPPTTEHVDEATGITTYESIPIRIVYVRDPVVFMNDTDSSYFLTTCPEVVLYGALSYGYDFIKDYENKALCEQKMMQGLTSLIAQLKAEDIPDTKTLGVPDESDGISMHQMYWYM